MKTPVFPARLAALPLALSWRFCCRFPAFSQTPAPADRWPPWVKTWSPPRAAPPAPTTWSATWWWSTASQIEASTARTLPELLARTAGLQMSANGATGKTSSVFIRGTESRHTILLIDGVRFGSATAGTPSWDNIPVEMIERIEVLKGPASALYGSEGVGGVVQIFTRRGKQGFHPYASATLGSERWRQWTGGFTGGQGAWTWALGLQQLRERGQSSTNPKVQFGNFNADVDPFTQDAINASLALQINRDWRADASCCIPMA
jgi:vitamin B12 transporter